MINSKPHPLLENPPDIYIFAIVSAFSFSSAKPGVSCSIKSSKSRRKKICFFFAVAQRYQNRSLCVWLQLSHWRRSAEEHRVYPLHQTGSGAGAVAGVTPPHPGNCNLSSGKPREPGFQHLFLCADWLAGQFIAAFLLFAICHLHSRPTRLLPHSTSP